VKLIWSLLAIERVSEIAEYIARDNPPAAQRWIEETFDRVGQLDRFPDSGRRLPEDPTRPDLREIIHGNYRIIYRLRPEGVDILTVRHGRQILPLDEIAEKAAPEKSE
jgi:plasmid stabilization system protein ParE